MFSLKHVIILAVSLALIIGLFIATKKFSLQKLTKYAFIIGVISEIIKVFFYTIRNEASLGGYLPKNDLPLQLCSIQIILLGLVLITKKESTKRFLYSFMYPTCLFGGIAALLIPAYSALNHWIITFQYFIYHIVIIVYALNLIRSDEFKLEIKDYVNCLLGLLLMMFVAVYANSIIFTPENQVNFMYVVRPPQEGLPFLTNKYGWLVYISHYFLLVLIVASLCYIKPIVRSLKNKLSSNKTSN